MIVNLKRHSLLVILAFLYLNNAICQESKGVVKIEFISTDKSSVYGFANIFDPTDSTLISSGIVENSVVEFNNIVDTLILVQSKIEGFNVSLHTLKVRNKDSVYRIRLTGHQNIEEVVVKGRSSLVSSSDNGSKTYNISNTTLASSNSTTDIMQMLPGISVIGNRVFLLGKGEVSFFIDNVKVTFDQFSIFPINQIKSIEIISNPGAKYDSEGKAIVKINSKQRLKKGLDVTFFNSTTVNSLLLNRTKVSGLFGTNKFSSKFEVTNELGNTKINSFSDRTVSLNQDFWKYEFGDKELTRNQANWRYLLGAQYRFNERNQLNIEYYGGYQNLSMDINTFNTIQQNQDPEFKITTDNKGKLLIKNNNYLFNYKIDLDTLGSSFFIGIQSSNYSSSTEYLIEETRYLSNNAEDYFHKNISENIIRILAPQLDFNKTFSDSSNFEVGLKFSEANCTSVIDFSSSNTNTAFIPNPNFSNDFKYSEKILSGYANYDRKFGKGTYIAIGVRNEYTEIFARSVFFNAPVLDNDYFKVYPFLQVNQSIRKSNLALTLSRRINRPQYQDLDPYFWFQDSVTWVKGNPKLIPEITNSFDVVYSRKKIEFGLNYNYSTNPIRYIVQNNVLQEGSVIVTQNNLASASTLQGNFQGKMSNKTYAGFVNLIVFLTSYHDSYLQSSSVKPYPGFSISISNSLKFKKSFYCDVYLKYTSNHADGLTMNRSYGMFNVAFGKKAFENKFDVQLMYNDILQTFRIYQIIDNDEVSNSYRQYLNTSFIKLSLTYKIGLLKSDSYHKKAILKEELNRI